MAIKKKKKTEIRELETQYALTETCLWPYYETVPGWCGMVDKRGHSSHLHLPTTHNLTPKNWSYNPLMLISAMLCWEATRGGKSKCLSQIWSGQDTAPTNRTPKTQSTT